VARVYDHVSGEYYEVTTEEDVMEEESEEFICDECGEGFDTKRGLSMHKVQAH